MQPSIPRLLLTLLSLLSLVSASDLTATLSAWPLSAANPTVLGSITYNPITLTPLVTTLKPLGLGGDELIRIGSNNGNGNENGNEGSWTVTTPATLSNGKLVLHLDSEGRIYHVEVQQGKQAPEGVVGIQVEFVKLGKGTLPVLNKPVVLNAQGRVPETEKEKTFLQKYWWLLLGMFILIVGGGGDPAK